MASLTRSLWSDDDGSGTTGSVIDNAELQKIYDNIELDLESANYPTVTTKSIQDNVLVGMAVARFGGDVNTVVSQTAIASGATIAACHHGTKTVAFDSALLAAGTYRLRGPLKSAGGGTTTFGLYNLTDSPNASPIATITSGTDDAGTVITSSALTAADFPAPGTTKTYGIKPLVSGSGVEGHGYEIELVRTA